MSVMYIVLPLALVFVGGGVWAFVWGVKTGQFDDLDTPATRVALEDDAPLSDVPAAQAQSGGANRAKPAAAHAVEQREAC